MVSIKNKTAMTKRERRYLNRKKGVYHTIIYGANKFDWDGYIEFLNQCGLRFIDNGTRPFK
jgi:hypothetical protein